VASYGRKKEPPKSPSWLMEQPPIESSWQAEVRRNEEFIAQQLKEEQAKAGSANG
jgi:hypothetical protein